MDDASAKGVQNRTLELHIHLGQQVQCDVELLQCTLVVIDQCGRFCLSKKPFINGLPTREKGGFSMDISADMSQSRKDLDEGSFELIIRRSRCRRFIGA